MVLRVCGSLADGQRAESRSSLFRHSSAVISRISRSGRLLIMLLPHTRIFPDLACRVSSIPAFPYALPPSGSLVVSPRRTTMCSIASQIYRFGFGLIVLARKNHRQTQPINSATPNHKNAYAIHSRSGQITNAAPAHNSSATPATPSTSRPEMDRTMPSIANTPVALTWCQRIRPGAYLCQGYIRHLFFPFTGAPPHRNEGPA